MQPVGEDDTMGWIGVRVGENAKGWEESALPNSVLKGIPDDGGEARDATSEMKGQQLGDRP